MRFGTWKYMNVRKFFKSSLGWLKGLIFTETVVRHRSEREARKFGTKRFDKG